MNTFQSYGIIRYALKSESSHGYAIVLKTSGFNKGVQLSIMLVNTIIFVSEPNVFLANFVVLC